MSALHVQRYGAGPRLALAAHGITGSSAAWAVVARALPDDWTLVAPDLRGRGHSRDLPASTGLRDHVADLAELAADLVEENGGPLPLVGHSMGAFIAVHALADHPDLWSRVVLVDGGVALPLPEGADPDAVLDATLGPSLDRLSREFADEDAYVEAFRAHPALGPHWTDDVEAYARYDALPLPDGRVRARVKADSARADGRDLLVSGESFEPALRAATMPVRLLVAPYGMFGQPGGLLPEAGVAALPGSVAVETVDGTNHFTIVLGAEGAARVAAAITES